MKSSRILFIDRNSMSYILVSEALSEKDIDIVLAVNGAEAIQLFRNNPFFDMVITEIVLPDMDGFSLLKEIRKINPIVPVIVQTACIIDNLKRRCLNEGFNSFLEKPISVKQLVREVDTYLTYVHI